MASSCARQRCPIRGSELFDAATEKIGATRGQGADVKSSAKLVCPPGQEERVPPWVTDYMRQTCSVLETDSASVVLCAAVGDDADIEESAAGICARVPEQRAMIATVDHAATELVLTRSCADVAKLSYRLRGYGDVLGVGTADRFDRELRAALSGTLGGDISDTAWWQAGLGVDQGGLGFRPAAEVALPAFIASRLASRLAVGNMCGHTQEGALGAADALLRVYDARTDAAIEKYVATLPQVMHEEITNILMHG